MPAAKARKLNIPQEATESKGGGGNYAKLELPYDGPALCVKAEDHVKKGASKVTGWKVTYEVEGLSFDVHLSFSEAARWKIVQVFEAHGFDLAAGVAELDPNALVGDIVGVHIDMDEAEAYREIKWVYSLEDAEAAEEAIADYDPDEEASDEEEPDIL